MQEQIGGVEGIAVIDERLLDESVRRAAIGPRTRRLTGPRSKKPSPSANRKHLTLADYRALGAFRHALRKFLAFSEAGAKAQGLTTQQHQALLAIKTHDGREAMSVSELADCLLVKNHSALGLVERLEERGLIERRTSERDRRRVLLHLTKPAERVLATISRNNLGKLKSTMPVFTDLLHALEHLELPAHTGDAPPEDEPAAD